MLVLFFEVSALYNPDGYFKTLKVCITPWNKVNLKLYINHQLFPKLLYFKTQKILLKDLYSYYRILSLQFKVNKSKGIGELSRELTFENNCY